MKRKATNCIKLLWTSKYSMLEKNLKYMVKLNTRD